MKTSIETGNDAHRQNMESNVLWKHGRMKITEGLNFGLINKFEIKEWDNILDTALHMNNIDCKINSFINSLTKIEVFGDIER